MIFNAAEVELQIGRGGSGQLAAKRLRLALKVVPLRDERREPAGVLRQLFEQRPVDVVADADAEHAGVARLLLDQLKQRLALALLGQTVAQDDDVERAIGLAVFVRGRDRRRENRAAARLLLRQELNGGLFGRRINGAQVC